jgi:hypothetical protein
MLFRTRADALRERLDVLTAELDQPGATPSQAAHDRTAAIAGGGRCATGVLARLQRSWGPQSGMFMRDTVSGLDEDRRAAAGSGSHPAIVATAGWCA